MFKVKDKWVVENGTMPILEDYGFKKIGQHYFVDVNDSVRYYINRNARELEIEKDVELQQCDFCGKLIDVNYDGLSLLYKLIKNDIIEEV